MIKIKIISVNNTKNHLNVWNKWLISNKFISNS